MLVGDRCGDIIIVMAIVCLSRRSETMHFPLSSMTVLVIVDTSKYPQVMKMGTFRVLPK